ncbi:MAG TPA: type 4a pilus biogenesis protein PilO [Candidatus Methanoperedens sp.]|nr:type 4a pilus biogenesis protein PilO [Candidatus Methanoperedens sp.]
MASVLEQFEKVPLKQRALILLMLCALVGVGFWYLLYQPKAAQLTTARSQLATLSSEVQNLQTIEARNKEFKRMIAELKGQLDSARQQLPGEREIPLLLEQIALFGKEAGIEFTGFRPGAEVKKDFYNEVPMALAIRGPFHNIGVFLDKLSHYPRIISVLNLVMGNAQEKEGYLMLTSTCTATTYRYVQAQ